ncbi:hypothetical protein U0070_010520 [Myodes glareolus]|uniref:Uncharacterized protein n=1 Tax=Myodes glareolus TaxID=447135 RepID=A0AAW0I630_MYOGA
MAVGPRDTDGSKIPIDSDTDPGPPEDVTNQEVHDLLNDCELKYYLVDKYKGTAFVTLLNGEQAEAAIKAFHQSCLRERELSVQLQPTDALLCVAKLLPSLTQAQFEELVRRFGSLERCFLVVDHLPPGFNDVDALRQGLSAVYNPSFCWLACGQDGQLKALQYWSMRQQRADDLALGASHLRVSFCAPGPPGRSMLAALIAAQATALNQHSCLSQTSCSCWTIQAHLPPSSCCSILCYMRCQWQAGPFACASFMPLLSGPALSTALLQLAPHTQSQKKPEILEDSPLGTLQAGPQPVNSLLGELSAGQGGGLAPELPPCLGKSQPLLPPLMGPSWDDREPMSLVPSASQLTPSPSPVGLRGSSLRDL